MVGGNNNPRHYNEASFTKIFVGGLAWETQRDTLRRYFEQFGEILEAVVIIDKNTGRSKGYGFVTFKDPEAAMKACQNPSPIIEGRRANCNLAFLGANKNRPHAPQHGRLRPVPTMLASPAYHGSSSTFVHQISGQYPFPYSTYGYAGCSRDTMYPMNWYGFNGGQQFSPYYHQSTGARGPVGLIHNMYLFCAQYAHSSQAYGFGVQYPQMMQFPFIPRRYDSAGTLSFPSSMAMPTTGAVTTTEVVATGAGASQATGTTSEENSSTQSLQDKEMGSCNAKYLKS